MTFYENHNYCRWLSEVEAKTPRQIFDRLSSFTAEMFSSTSLRLLSGQALRERL